MGAMSGGAGDQSGAKGLSSLMGQNPNMVQPMTQNVTPLKPLLSGDGLSQAQANGANQFSSGKGQPSSPTLMQGTPPGQAQNTITSGQPIMGQPNQYMNTTGQGNQPFTYAQHNNGNGKGKG